MRESTRASLLGFLLLLAVFLMGTPARTRTLSPESRPVVATIDSLWSSWHRDEAMAFLGKAIPEARAAPDSTLLVNLLWRRGSFLIATGDYRGAREWLLEAVQLADALADTASLCPSLRWLSLTNPGSGGPAETDRILRRLVATAASVGDRSHEGWGHVGLAYKAWNAGNADDALAHYETAAELFIPTSDTEGVIWSQNGIAMVRSSR